MMSERSMEIIGEFTRMPQTPEKKEIVRAFEYDEIGTFELLQKAEAYIASNDNHEA